MENFTDPACQADCDDLAPGDCAAFDARGLCRIDAEAEKHSRRMAARDGTHEAVNNGNAEAGEAASQDDKISLSILDHARRILAATAFCWSPEGNW